MIDEITETIDEEMCEESEIEYITVQQAAAILCVSVKKIKSMAWSGKLSGSYRDPYGHWLIPRESVRFLDWEN